jgi:SAM-dependent methyltransferase
MHDGGFEAWYRSSKAYRRAWVPHGIDQLSILRSLFRYRRYAQGVLLDIGCGARKFEDVFNERVTAYWGLDLPSAKGANVYAEATHLPIRDGSVATVLSTQVLGYVYDHQRMLHEIRRVLQPGGCAILTYSQSAGQADESDYFRFTPAYYKRALGEAGLRLEVLEARTGTLGMIGENLTTMIYYRGATSGIRLRIKREVCHRLQQLFIFLDRIYFDPHSGIGHIVIARKP